MRLLIGNRSEENIILDGQIEHYSLLKHWWCIQRYLNQVVKQFSRGQIPLPIRRRCIVIRDLFMHPVCGSPTASCRRTGGSIITDLGIKSCLETAVARANINPCQHMFYERQIMRTERIPAKG